jgi:DNA-binding NtrC family response regulator
MNSAAASFPGSVSARLAEGAVELIGRSAAAVRLQELVRRAAQMDGSVLIAGDRGTDLEPLAREVHKRGRAGGACVIVDCGVPDAVGLERALFGSPAAVSAADLETIAADSWVASARGGTLLLTSVTELPASLQARIARIARDREVYIDGAPAATELRIIATASSSIDADVRENRFRADLYRRIAASRIDVAPLRERAEDVPEIAAHLLQEATAEDAAPRTFTQAALALLAALSWPGNMSELRSAVERVAVTGVPGGTIQIEHVLPALNLERAQAPFTPAGNLREARLRFERDYIASVLQHHGWRMAEAAQTLGIQRPNLYRKARQLGIPVARLSE